MKTVILAYSQNNVFHAALCERGDLRDRHPRLGSQKVSVFLLRIWLEFSRFHFALSVAVPRHFLQVPSFLRGISYEFVNQGLKGLGGRIVLTRLGKLLRLQLLGIHREPACGLG